MPFVVEVSMMIEIIKNRGTVLLSESLTLFEKAIKNQGVLIPLDVKFIFIDNNPRSLKLSQVLFHAKSSFGEIVDGSATRI
jgi:hypothetical protein